MSERSVPREIGHSSVIAGGAAIVETMVSSLVKMRLKNFIVGLQSGFIIGRFSISGA
jgi:hypothetical protein